MWPSTSVKAVITCDHNTWFEYRNVSSVTMSGLEFIECFETQVVSVGHFQLENSRFLGNGQGIVNGTVLRIDESTVSVLDTPRNNIILIIILLY